MECDFVFLVGEEYLVVTLVEDMLCDRSFLKVSVLTESIALVSVFVGPVFTESSDDDDAAERDFALCFGHRDLKSKLEDREDLRDCIEDGVSGSGKDDDDDNEDEEEETGGRTGGESLMLDCFSCSSLTSSSNRKGDMQTFSSSSVTPPSLE